MKKTFYLVVHINKIYILIKIKYIYQIIFSNKVNDDAFNRLTNTLLKMKLLTNISIDIKMYFYFYLQ